MSSGPSRNPASERTEVQPGAVDDLQANSAELVAKLKHLQAIATQLSEACGRACMAEELLRGQVDSVAILAALAEGEPQLESHVDAAMRAAEGVFQMRWRLLEEVRQAHQCMRGTLSANNCQGEPYQLPWTVLVPHNRAWNKAQSPLLNLPDSALRLIAHAVGRRARALCRRMAEVYGSPGTGLSWSPYPSDTRHPTHATLMAGFLAHLRAWRWRPQVTSLRLTSTVQLSPEAVSEIAATMPQLQRVECVSAAAGSPAAPLLPRLTKLRCTVPEQAHLALPFEAPALASLKLVLPGRATHPQVDVAAVLVRQPALRKLRLDSGGGVLTQTVRANVVQGLVAMGEGLERLTLGDACCLADQLVATSDNGRMLQVTKLVLHDRVAKALELGWLPTLQQFPRLTALHLRSLPLQQCTLPDLATFFGGGSTRLRHLALPPLMFFTGPEQASMREQLTALYRTLPALTALRAGCIFGRYGNSFHYTAPLFAPVSAPAADPPAGPSSSGPAPPTAPTNPAPAPADPAHHPAPAVPADHPHAAGPADHPPPAGPAAGPPGTTLSAALPPYSTLPTTSPLSWLDGIERLTQLQRLHLTIDVEELAHLSALQPLSLLTQLHLDVPVQLPLPEFMSEQRPLVAGRLGALTQLRQLGLTVRCGVVRCAKLRRLVAEVVGQAAALPRLEVLDLSGLTRVDEVVLGALLEPACRVPGLWVAKGEVQVGGGGGQGGAGVDSSSRGGTELLERLQLKYEVTVVRGVGEQGGGAGPGGSG